MREAKERGSGGSAAAASGAPRPSPYVSPGGELPLSNPAQLELLRGVTERGRPLRMKVRGFSMTPLIRDDDVLTIAPMDGRGPRVGEVVAFTLPATGTLAIHRVVAREGAGWLLRGDSCLENDGVVMSDQIVGRVARVERNGRDVRLGAGVGGAWVAVLSRGGWLVRLRAVRNVARRAASSALRWAQGFAVYRAVGRRLAVRVEITQAREADMAAVHRRLTPAESYRAQPADPHVTNWVARRGTRIIGFVQLVERPESDSPWAGHWLFSLIVWGRYRGLGVGEALTRRVIEQARSRGATELLLAVLEDDERATRLYSKLGFAPCVIEVLEPDLEAERRRCGRRRVVMRRRVTANP